MDSELVIRFDDQVGVFTGAGAGMGAAAARGFAAGGGHAVVADVDAAAAEKTVVAIQGFGGSAESMTVDVSTPDDIDRMVGTTLDRHGRLDVLHNHPFGITKATQNHIPLHEYTDQSWNAHLTGGVTAAFRAIKAAAPAMVAAGRGSIVNTASICGLRGDRGTAGYSSTKAAVINLTRVAALEYAEFGVRVNAICPGPIMTDALRASMERRSVLRDNYQSRIPLARLGEPAEVSNAILFLASNLASFVTGAVFVVDGGTSIRTGLPDFLA